MQGVRKNVIHYCCSMRCLMNDTVDSNPHQQNRYVFRESSRLKELRRCFGDRGNDGNDDVYDNDSDGDDEAADDDSAYDDDDDYG